MFHSTNVTTKSQHNIFLEPPEIPQQEKEFNVAGDRDVFRIQLKQTKAGKSSLVDMMNNPDENVQAERMMNLEVQTLLRSEPKLAQLGNVSFNKNQPSQDIQLDDGRKAWTGFTANIRQGQDGLFLNFDTTVRPVLEAGTVMQILGIKSDGKLSEQDRRRANMVLEKVKVKDSKVNFTRTITEVSKFDSSYKFTDQDGKQLTVQQYYKQQFGYTLKYPKLNLLDVSRKSQKKLTLIPMEICSVKESVVEKIKDRQLSKIIRFAAMKPDKRKEDVKEASKVVQQTPLQSIKSIKDKLQQVEARTIPPPILNYGDNRYFKFISQDGMNGSWDKQ
eukprot:TRINITY_DN24504_c0_g1_i1.p1 TRINITY_DN24504_c0_g1~~TRINITY_DN24504_c0_g1_i1.p1  ORF type:complete len:332 (+),score=33.25 TRINITY_DN24504_c0_g1_i1:169-1164(+)